MPRHNAPARLISIVLVLLSTTAATEKLAPRIWPGPKEMSEEEKAIQPDLASGAQHGVILLEETELEEIPGSLDRHTFHMRAKILSGEGRALANITIPFDDASGHLEEWWGRTLLPDGTVLELKKDALKRQTIAEGGGAKFQVLKAALPGVVPGCVIDYGYVFREPGAGPWGRMGVIRYIDLQREWPVRRLRYRWRPSGPAKYFLRRRTDSVVEVRREMNSILIDGKDLPLAVDEPFMPPRQVSHSGATLYYKAITKEQVLDPNLYWDDLSRARHDRIEEFLKKPEPLKKTLADMALPADASLDEKLRAVYEWMGANIKNRPLLTSEEAEVAEASDHAREQKEKHSAFPYHRKWWTLEEILASKESIHTDLGQVFIGFARELGAEAHLVLAPDRRDGIWEKGLLSGHQLKGGLVAVRPLGAPLDGAKVVAPGSGLAYGEIPWWASGTKALVVLPKKAGEIELRSSEHRRNILTTMAAYDFGEGDRPAHIAWSAAGLGQRGYQERIALRRQAPDERAERLRELCGASGDFEVTMSQAPGLEDQPGGFGLACEGDLVTQGIDDSMPGFSLSFEGPWIPAVPRFVSTKRVYPIVFNYPRMDMTTVRVPAPAGYVPLSEPPNVRLDGPYGTYSLRISIADGAYRVERSFTLTPLAVKVEGYAGLRRYLEQVHEADRTRLEFTRKEAIP